jgi:hypothetical protein
MENLVRDDVAHRTYHNYLSQIRNHMLPGTRQEEAPSAHTGGCGGPLPFHDCFRVFIHNQSATSTLSSRELSAGCDPGADPPQRPRGASLPGLNRKEMQTLTPEQVKRILKAVEGDRLEALYEVDTEINSGGQNTFVAQLRDRCDTAFLVERKGELET